MTYSRRRVAWLIAAALVAAAVDTAVVLSSDLQSGRGWHVAIGVAVAWSFIGTGLFAWSRRPDSRTGPLMMAVGYAWFLTPLDYANSPWLFLIGSVLGSLTFAVLIHLILSFPDGRLHSRLERVVVGGGYVATTVLPIPAYLFFDTESSSRCDNCPANPILIHDSDLLLTIFVGILNAVGFVLLVMTIVLMRRRWKASTSAQRRALGPVIWAAGMAFIGLALLLVTVFIPGLDENHPAVRNAIFLVAVVIITTVPFGFLVGFMRAKLSRADAVGQLVDRLAQQGDRRPSLRDALSEALRDPSLEIAYWLPERRRYADAAGRPFELPGEDSGRTVTTVEREGQAIAVVVTDGELVEEGELVRALGGALALTMENERLTAELRARVEELRASRARIVRAGDDERRRLERDLHDGAQQRLVALALNVKLARASLDKDPDGVRELLDDAIDELSEATTELRELARGIHPAVLTDRGLEAAVMALAARTAVPVELLALPDERLAAPVESTAYFVVAESLTNVVRYSQASHAEVEITRDNGRVVIEVRDDGVGGADPGRGSGLRGLADRVGAVDGRLAVDSPAGGGTNVHAEIPCER
ncbi:MAG TPA: sensor histidine kinase [Thermoleophilaceae bacterium]|nr:sensor histidine kinase [Thermoleophilaceae bacterium]